MALTVDNSGGATSDDKQTSLAFNFTNAGDFMVVGVVYRFDGGQALESVTYNGMAMSFMGSFQTSDSAVWCQGYKLVQPDTGTHQVLVTFSGTATRFVAGAISFTGTDPSVPISQASQISQGEDTAPTNTTTTTTSGDLVLDLMGAQGESLLGAPTATVGAGQTERWNQEAAGGPSEPTLEVRGAMSTEPAGGAITMSWTLSATTKWAMFSWVVNANPFSESLPPFQQARSIL